MAEPTPAQQAGARLAEVRTIAGLSLGQAARLTGLHRSLLEAWEAGEDRSDDETIAQLAEVYDAPVLELLRLDRSPRKLEAELVDALDRSTASAKNKARLRRLIEVSRG